MKPLLVAVLAAGALAGGATASSVGAAGPTHPLLGVVPHTAHARTAFAAARRTAGFNCVSACSAYESSINQYFTDVAAASGATDNVYSVPTQYYQQTSATPIAYDTTFGGSYVDGNPFPALGGCDDGQNTFCVTDSQLQTQIKKAIAANHWPATSTDLFFIFTPANVGVCFLAGGPSNSNPCTTNAFCAYHRSTAQNVLYAVEPDAAAVPGLGCDNGLETPVGNGADDTINTISHEHIEAITDPLGTAWQSNDTGNPEIGDLCAYDFGTPLGGADGAQYNQSINGHPYLLQLEYSNADGGCVPYLGGPVTAPDPALPDGIGPLAYQNADAPVMLTNTVYAIYWVPVPPVNRALPKIAGTAKVGQTLSASRGHWTHFPTKYGYQWFRCSPAGTLCRAIAKATTSSRTLKEADATHKLYVRITATNAAGSTTANSAFTKTVRK